MIDLIGLYKQGLKALGSKKYREASDIFRFILGLDLDESSKDYARLKLAAALHGCNLLFPAINLLLGVLRKKRESPVFVYAIIHYASICFELGLAQHWLRVCKKLHIDFDDLGSLNGRQLLMIRGAARLLIGDYKNGWTDFELRSAGGMSSDLELSIPRLKLCSDMSSKAVLLLVDQGLGDALFSLRFIPLLRGKVQSIVIACNSNLRPFLMSLGLFDDVLDDAHIPLDSLDCWTYLTSLPVILDVQSPRQCPMPVLSMDLGALAAECPSFVPTGEKPLVALNWCGNTALENVYSLGVRERSFSLSDLESVASLQKCSLISVQIGLAAADKLNSAFAELWHQQQGWFDSAPQDLLKTACILKNVDLLITNDTSVAHLGGCLGVPTWVVLKASPSWHWGDQAELSPWYSNVRCFRQSRLFDWKGVMDDVDVALSNWISKSPRHRAVTKSSAHER